MPRDIKKLIQEHMNRAAFIRAQEEKAVRRKAVRAPVPAARRGTLFAGRNKRLAIQEAALRHAQIIVTYVKLTTGRRVKRILAPYSIKWRKLKVGKRKVLYGYDFKDKHIKSLMMRNIRKVAITDRRFRPKWPIEFVGVEIGT